MKTNHIFTITSIYCRKLNEVLDFGKEHFDNQCMDNCPYFVGDAQNEGIECFFDSGSNRSFIKNPDPYILSTRINKTGLKELFNNLK